MTLIFVGVLLKESKVLGSTGKVVIGESLEPAGEGSYWRNS